MNMRIIGSTKDLRTNTAVLYVQLLIDDYLDLVGEDFDNFAIQRKREKHKAYSRLKKDVINGALLPPITLAVEPENVKSLLEPLENKDFGKICEILQNKVKVNILDGLQRTYILKDLKAEGQKFVSDHYLLIEVWLEEDIHNLIYRIIVLNAGQKPMSLRHQIEVLFSTFKNNLEVEIYGLELFPEKDTARRTKFGKFPLDRVVAAYQSFLSRSPEIHKENIVAQKLTEEDILSESEESLSKKYNSFKNYLKYYVSLDHEICRIYNESNSELPTGLSWFGNENVMNSFFAAISDFGSSEQRCKRINKALDLLLQQLKDTQVANDILGLGVYQKVTRGFNVRKINVGFATRKLITSAFKEYFREEGEISLAKLWQSEAE